MTEEETNYIHSAFLSKPHPLRWAAVLFYACGRRDTAPDKLWLPMRAQPRRGQQDSAAQFKSAPDPWLALPQQGELSAQLTERITHAKREIYAAERHPSQKLSPPSCRFASSHLPLLRQGEALVLCIYLPVADTKSSRCAFARWELVCFCLVLLLT